jgi:hypothetical protein
VSRGWLPSRCSRRAAPWLRAESRQRLPRRG